MKLKIYQVDAFAQQVFSGNPAAVIPLKTWLPDELMQQIAQENNLSETVFFVADNQAFKIRWFTPVSEVKLCGHATLAAAFVIFNQLNYQQDTIVFSSLSGELKVTKHQDWLALDFPAQPAQPVELPDALIKGLGKAPQVCLAAEDYLAVFDSEAELMAINPDVTELEKLAYRGVIVTAPSEQYDFVARFFAPKVGIKEDPVTGSAFTQLMPYWTNRLAKKALFAKQVSARGGELKCELTGDRVFISGQAVLYLQGEIEV
ncbi:PhzF family phenazine biosynthesis protein [Catenovulum sp. 2E275]|uniref:PhzF family phenazine biosynthesis protein n=1 Tax=Catenovulum sp. 2E275 TaxID=2980497 RepID=UPI0021CFCD0E|nr:PhzF family phenazine biosynthesis protein [Catenovulum sp. 2E275]MCU4674328.1 PhzF family phenazine biosynthesis protein [Catenovulum sp. 2E275]